MSLVGVESYVSLFRDAYRTGDEAGAERLAEQLARQSCETVIAVWRRLSESREAGEDLEEVKFYHKVLRWDVVAAAKSYVKLEESDGR